DCDVVQADGGTRTASITGAFVALKLALDNLLQTQELKTDPIREVAAALSVGMLADNTAEIDLHSPEDSQCELARNIAMTESGHFIELQASGEEATFDDNQLNELILLGKKGIEDLIRQQKNALYASDEQRHRLGEKTIMIATGNPGKAREFAKMFAPFGYSIKTLKDF